MAESVLDFRSDTVTRPSKAMRRAMHDAAVGDDVFGEDPTVLELEERCADMLGFEKALFVPSGTMANNLGIAVSTRPGDEIILLDDAHTYLYEVGGSARLWGVHARPLRAPSGCPSPEQIEGAIRADDQHLPRTSLVLLENTHNMQGGKVVAPETLAPVAETCRRHQLRIHLDGARLFNAAAALERPLRDFTQHVDSVSCCFSKGLGCPVGSIFAGDAESVREAHRVRKLLGGGMRQVGVLAACAAVALEEEVPRLGEDHERAQRLARSLAECPQLDVEPPQSNILMIRFRPHPSERTTIWQKLLQEKGLWAMALPDYGLRLVLHRDLDAAAIDRAERILLETVEDPRLAHKS